MKPLSLSLWVGQEIKEYKMAIIQKKLKVRMSKKVITIY